MHAQILKYIQDLRASYWFVPTCMVLAAVLLSALMNWLDSRYGAEWLRGYSWLTATRTEGARSVLTVIAGSIIGVAGVTFSITMVAVSFASANFGPRLVGNFMRDRGNQFTLGTFIGTFVYCLMVLRTVRNASAQDASTSYDAFVPHLSILVALTLALASVGVLIFFIHHVPETINVGNLASKVGAALRKGVVDLFPDTDDMQPDEESSDVSWDGRTRGRWHFPVYAGISGYIQTLLVKRLGEITGEHDLLVRVQYRPGDFVINNSIVFDVWSNTEVSEDVIAKLEACIAVGTHRTAHQNVLFLADELVEIIGRALSPGINDPFTAITCLNWLKVGIACFLLEVEKRQRPESSDPVWLYPITFERFVSAIFDQTRQYVCTDRNVALHTIALLTELAALSQPGFRRDLLLDHMKKLADACAEVLPEFSGGIEVAKRYDDALKILSDPDGYDVYRNSQGWFGGRA